MTSHKSKPILIIGFIAIISFALGYWLVSNSGDNKSSNFEDEKSLAVLPFNNKLASDEGFFVSGITEDIRNQIARIGDLRVLSRFTINDYEVGGKTLARIGDELGVSFLLSGDVSRENRKLIVNCRLLNTASQSESWSETFRGDESDVFTIQNNIALRIADIMQSQITDEEKEKISSRSTISVSAYNIYLQGRALYQEYNSADNELAINYFKEALNQDADYALALAGLSDAYSQAVKAFGTRRLTYLDSAIWIGKKSVEVDPNLAEGWKALGLAYSFEGNKEKARACYQKSLALNPNYFPALSNLAGIYGEEGNLAEAISMELRSTQLDPINFISYDNLTNYYNQLAMDIKAKKYAMMTLDRLSDETAKAIVSHDIHYFVFGNATLALEHLEKERPDSLSTLTLAGICARLAYYHEEDISKLIATITNRADYNTQLHTEIPIIEASIMLSQNKIESAQQKLKDQLNFYLGEQQKGNTNYDFEIVLVYALLEEKEKAIDALNTAIESGYTSLDRIEKNKFLKKYQSDFEDSLSKLRKRLSEIKNELEVEEVAI